MNYKIILVALLIISLTSCQSNKNISVNNTYDWNNGKCLECNGELIYDRTGSKEHYICSECGKEYTFDKIMSKKEESE